MKRSVYAATETTGRPPKFIDRSDLDIYFKLLQEVENKVIQAVSMINLNIHRDKAGISFVHARSTNKYILSFTVTNDHVYSKKTSKPLSQRFRFDTEAVLANDIPTLAVNIRETFNKNSNGFTQTYINPIYTLAPYSNNATLEHLTLSKNQIVFTRS